ncbi:MAG: hypothetical protein ACI31W_05110 [Lactococcus sp.]
MKKEKLLNWALIYLLVTIIFLCIGWILGLESSIIDDGNLVFNAVYLWPAFLPFIAMLLFTWRWRFSDSDDSSKNEISDIDTSDKRED